MDHLRRTLDEIAFIRLHCDRLMQILAIRHPPLHPSKESVQRGRAEVKFGSGNHGHHNRVTDPHFDRFEPIGTNSSGKVVAKLEISGQFSCLQ